MNSPLIHKVTVYCHAAMLSSFILASANTSAKEVIINDNGGWCWYQDERAIISNGKLLVASVASKLGTGGDARGGNIEVVTYPLNQTSNPMRKVLHDGLEDDDHNVPALLELPNNDVLAVYSKHNTDKMVRYRIAKADTGLSQWQKEVAMPRKDKITYANLMHLSNENQGRGKLYNFYRGINFNPSFDTSDDNGQTWSKGTHFMMNKGRPYVKYISNNKDEIHFVTTEQHPRVFNNSIYHGYLKADKVFASDGTFIQHISDGPINPTALTKVYRGGPNNVAWTTDLHLDDNDMPFTLFSVQVNDADKDRHKGQMHGDDMRYYYAKWTGARWQVNEIAYAGSRLYNREQDYTGLAALNPQNPNEIVISTNANPKTGDPLISHADGKRHWELFKGISPDDGKTWQWHYLTKDSMQDNLRPIIPVSDSSDLLLLWMRGIYTSYTEMDTEIVLRTNPKIIAKVE